MLRVEEKAILKQVDFNEPALLLNRFKGLIRISGSEDEKAAACYIAGRLEEFGVPYEILWPEVFLSVPKRADFKIIGHQMDITAKTPSYSMSTGDKWVDGELIFASSYRPPFTTNEIGYKLRFEGNPNGKIVICEGIPSPDKVNDIIDNGGVAAIFMQPGERIHECICTSIWGTPGLDDFNKVMRIPVVSINNPDGNTVISMIKEGQVRAAVRTELDEGWKRCPLVLARIPGNMEPERFVLLHGHIDSWHAGIGDNGLGDATLLEIARVLHLNRQKLKRSVWVAWWPGHSTGRFAGSTWFADNYAMELYENCIAQVNCESTGCAGANSYEGIMWTEDVDCFCRKLVEEVTGIEPVWTRPIRAGDYSFNNIGITSFFMQSSTIGEKKMKELGYYQVYGCGGNIEWHTEADDMRLVDRKIFLRDTRLYLAGVFRMANADIIPIDCRGMLDSMERYLLEYRYTAGDKFDLEPLFSEIGALRSLMNDFYEKIGECAGSAEKRQLICDTILKVERKLIRINYTGSEEFGHDPAVMVPPIPDIAPVLKINQMSRDEQKFLIAQLTRSRNRVQHVLKECRQLIERTAL